MTDEELVLDAHAFAKRLTDALSEKHVMIDSDDGQPWAVIMLTEFARLIGVSFVAAYEPQSPRMFSYFMSQVAKAIGGHALSPKLIDISIAEARAVAAKVDAAPRRQQ